ncbi:MAG TPA: SpoIVB peptidase [Clostridia bacterium]|nr:SpoIVB peptidase [Clostridia bacterium]
MRKLTFLRKALVVFAISALTAVAVSYIKVQLTVPGEMILIEGEEYTYHIDSIFPISIKADTEGIMKINGKTLESSYNPIGISKPVSISSDKGGSVRLNLRFFGILPVKTVNVDIVSNKQVVACGNTIGVKIKLDGILVIGISDVESKGQKIIPVRNSGIRPGYKIISVDDKLVGSIEELVDIIEQSNGQPLKISYSSGSETLDTTVSPVMSSDDDKYHIGLWVRDSTAGIGTLTYYDADTGRFGALGHGITDIDTGTLMSVESGEIMESSILGVKKGTQGDPGELKGIFSEGTKLGVIQTNSNIGIYGKIDKRSVSKLSGRVYPIGVRAEITEGPATILSNIDGKKIEEYGIMIQKVSRQNLNGSKGMIIKVIDDRLLSTTGGIVQGMSGSPILQNGKIIGAVTHVLVNDPTRGYGIFIETMLKNTSI